MIFNTDIESAPRNTPLVLKVDLGVSFQGVNIGIGAIKTYDFQGRFHEDVQYSHVSNQFGGIGVSSPSPVRVEDLIAWAPYPNETPTDVEKGSLRTAALKNALTAIRDHAAIAAQYGDFDTLTIALNAIAETAQQTLKDE